MSFPHSLSTTANTVPSLTNESGMSMNLAYRPKKGNEREQDRTPAPNVNKAGFLENLSFRPRPADKRKRELSPPPDDSNAADTHAPADTSLQDNTEHDEKRRRGNHVLDELSAEDLLHLFGELTPEAAKDANLDMAVALEAVKLKETVAERVARRRRAAAEPFVIRKNGFKGALARWRQHNRPPVFGLASLMGPDEQTMVLALREAVRQKVKFVKFLPFVEDPKAQRVTRAQAKKVVVEKFCACRCSFDDTLVQCRFCQKHFHPACVGKGLHGEDGNHGDRQHAARLSDATYYREKADFTCPDCDERWFTKKRWTTRKYKAEEQRRGKLFSAKDWLGVDGRPKKCSNCKDQINSKRYECIYCEHFDLCRRCFSDPYISSKHEHEEGDMVLRPRK